MVTRPVVVISASIGAGHDGAARELARRLTRLGFPVLRLDFLDLLPPGLGCALRSTYARQLRTAPATWGWLLRAAAGPRLSAQAAALSARAAAGRMLAAIDPAAAVVISTYPLATQVLGRLRRCGRVTAPTAAVMTDPSVHTLCVAPGIDVHLAPGLPTAAQVQRHGFQAVPVSPIVDPAFRPVHHNAEKAAARRRLGLPTDERLAVVVAGSWGVGDVEWTARDTAASGTAIPVVVCGRNDFLRRRLGRSGDAIALGWVGTMPELLRAADVVVHNASGLSSVEAMASGVPLISYRCLPGHGAANAAVLAAANLSPWPHTPHELAAELSLALDGSAILRQRAALAAAAASADAAEVIAGLAGIVAPPAGSMAA
ncbi:MGDG synthase family glycosyltransferase [Micromonospora sp. CA-244673]|uniref:MGDG synthase family glycosyltransferase n=1 Tax=Micromonospora sp. CA-244673 TaxID=3239958 RepID=UPI003D8BDF0A